MASSGRIASNSRPLGTCLASTLTLIIVLAWAPSSSGARRAVPPGSGNLQKSDFVYVAPCSVHRLVMAYASRYWRKGMRAAFVCDTENPPQHMRESAQRWNESIGSFPSFTMFPDGKVRHYMPGDRRAAMTPVIAHQLLGDTYKWMLFGDDDTIFFMHGVRNLLKDYDHNLPYFLTDSMYEGSVSPKPGVWDLRCYPCHEAHKGLAREPREEYLRKCNCTTQTLCAKFKGKEQECATQWEGPVPFGGVGMVFSVGFFRELMSRVSLQAYTDCVMNTTLDKFPQGGDAIMSRCLFRLGFPITEMGYTKFGRYLGEIITEHHLYQVPRNLTQGLMSAQQLKELEERWRTAVTIHLEARMMKSWRHAITLVRYMVATYDLVAEHLWGDQVQQEGDQGRKLWAGQKQRDAAAAATKAMLR